MTMDYMTTRQELEELTQQVCSLANIYMASRSLSGEAKTKLDIILASKLKDLRKIRSNIGYDMGLIALMEDGDKEIENYYTTYMTETDKYKGLEKVINALETKISVIQSMLKYEKDHAG